MSNALTVYQPQTLEELKEVATILANSGYFSDAKGAAQAAAKIIAGQEMGIGPMAAMTGIHIIKGKVATGGNLLATKVKEHPKYDYRVKRLDDTGCEIEFYELSNGQREVIGISAFDKSNAVAAGLLSQNGNYGKFPRNMYFNRAMSNGIKWYCPDAISGGSPVYTPDELGAPVDDDGNVIEGSFQEIPQQKQQSGPRLIAPWDRPGLVKRVMSLFAINETTAKQGLKDRTADKTINAAMTDDEIYDILKARKNTAANGKSDTTPQQQPLTEPPQQQQQQAPDPFKSRTEPITDPLALQNAVAAQQKNWRGDVSAKQKATLAILVSKALPDLTGDDQAEARHAITDALFGKPGLSELTKAEAGAMIDWLTAADSTDLHPCAAAEIDALL